MKDFAGRTAFITGGAQGIGLGIARSLARRGVKLALADIDEAVLRSAEDELKGLTDVRSYRLDVSDRRAFAETAEAAEQALGPVTLLFNNAGVAAAAPVANLTYDMWDWTLGVNLMGVVNGVQTFVSRMIAGGRGGYVVNTSSGAGLAYTGAGILYHTTKYAVVGMSEALHFELKAQGIGVSVLCPGAQAPEAKQSAALDSARKFLAQGTPPDAVGEMVVKAIEAERLYVYTDTMMENFIRQRMNDLLAALPAKAV